MSRTRLGSRPGPASSGGVALRVAVAWVLLALFAACSTPGPPPQPERPASVLLITVDTLRPDALGWVAGRNRTPALDGLALEGVRFPAAVSPVPLTLPAHASLMTGLDPSRHGVHDNGQLLGDGVATLAELLEARGYRTAAFVSGFPLKAMFGLDRGFGHYDDAMSGGSEGRVERIASETSRAASAWIAGQAGPWFAWVHFYDPHDPYEPPRTFWRPGERGAYDGEVEFVDDAIAGMLEAIEGEDEPNLLTVFTADHGEALGEHGENTHGYFIYDSTITVPLVFHQPGRIPAAAREDPARLVDVFPTVLELLGVESNEAINGVSLVPALYGKRQEVPPAAIESEMPWRYFGWAPLSGLRDGAWKLIEAPRPELYDLERDPTESTNVIDEHPDVAARMREEIAWRLEQSVADAGDEADPEALERLRSLGYVGVGSSPPVDRPAGLADPKDRLAERALLLDGERAMGRGAYDAAVGLFEELLASEPDNRAAVLRAGTALLKKGSLEDALPYLERAVLVDPERPDGRFALGDVLTRLGKFERAAVEWAELARLQPRRAEAWANLGTVLRSSGRPGDAIEALERAVELVPLDPAMREGLILARLDLARLEVRAGRLPAARAQVEAALALDASAGDLLRAAPELRDLLP